MEPYHTEVRCGRYKLLFIGHAHRLNGIFGLRHYDFFGDVIVYNGDKSELFKDVGVSSPGYLGEISWQYAPTFLEVLVLPSLKERKEFGYR